MCASFCAGTRILTTRGRVRVEKLRLGDEAITVSHGPLPIRWIGQRIYGRHFARLNPNSVPVMIKAGALDEGVPSRDLCLSPLHNIYVDGALIPAGELVNQSSVRLCDEMDPIAYYHLELPMHAIVLAEDLPAESYVDRGDRAKFLTSSSTGLGEDASQSWASCAPILHSGPVVERVRARLALRAGITPPDIMERPQTGPLVGKLEWADHAMISGWAWLPDHPDVPVVLEVLDRGEVIAVALADRFRTDLRRAGIGDGSHAFHIDLPQPLDPQLAHHLVIRRAADALALAGCPVHLAPHQPSTALSRIDLATLIENADPAEMGRVLDWLELQVSKLHTLLLKPQEGVAAVPIPALAGAAPVVAEVRPRRIRMKRRV